MGDAFLVEVVPAGGLGSRAPLTLAAGQLVVRMPDGTPVLVVAAVGGRELKIVKTGDPGYESAFREAGVDPADCRFLKPPPPPHGARLVKSPGG